MPQSTHTLDALRALISARFPERPRGAFEGTAASAASVDGALGGGLPAGRLTEIVSPGPGAGGQTVFARLLAATRLARKRLALVDAADAFAPESVPQDDLRHLLWVRCACLDQAMAAADILVRDGNYAVLALDLRGYAARALRSIPSTLWYRLQRAAEPGSVAVLVQTPEPLVPAVPARLILEGGLGLAMVQEPREVLADRLSLRVERGKFEAKEIAV